MATMTTEGKKMAQELCEEIGNCFGSFFKENGKLCIDNGEKVFRYDTEEDLLEDWVDTLICQHVSFNGEEGANWEQEVRFIYETVIGKYPKGVRAYHGKRKTTYKAEGYVPTGDGHGKMVYLGGYNSIIDAICSARKYYGIAV